MSMIKVDVGGHRIGSREGMEKARHMAVRHVIGLVINGELRTGEPVEVVYRCGGRVLLTSQMIGPDMSGDLQVL